MANTVVSVQLYPGLTGHKLKLFQADALVNSAGGDDLTAGTNNTDVYVATVTEAVTGDVYARVEDASGNVIANGAVYGMADDTETYPVEAVRTTTAGTVDANVVQWRGSTPAVLADTDKVSVSAQHLADDVISATKIADDAISEDQLAASAVTKIWNNMIVMTNGNSVAAYVLLKDLFEATVADTGTVDNSLSDATTTVFKTDLAQANDYWNDALLVFTSGALLGQTRPIADFANTNGVITLDEALTSIPSNGVQFAVLARHIHPVSQIQNGLATSTAQTTAQNDLDILTGTDGVTLATTQANYAPSIAGDLMGLANDAITAAKFDESTAFPLTAVNGSSLTEAGGTGDHLTALGDARIANLDAAVSSRGTYSGGNITGNLSGSVGSVTDPVTAGTVNDKTGYGLASDGLDLTQLHLDWVNGGRLDLIIDTILADSASLNDTVLAEIATATDIPATPTLRQAVMLVYMWLRNNTQDTATARKVLNDAGTTVLQGTMADNGTTFTQGKLGNP